MEMMDKIAVMTEKELDELEGFISGVRSAIAAIKAAHNQVDKAPDAASCESSFTCPKCGHVHDYQGNSDLIMHLHDQHGDQPEQFIWECYGCEQEMTVEADWNPRFTVQEVEG